MPALAEEPLPDVEAELPGEPVPALSLEARLTTDVMGVAQGAVGTGVRLLANLDLVGDLDLEKLMGWRGARVRVHVLSNHGGRPNDLAGTIQGVDNIEVSQNLTKLYQAWIEQDLSGGKATLLLGLADLNAYFYQNDSAGLLLGPAFGVGSELAATGTNGPSIFPSTALTAKLWVALGSDGYAQGAVVNAHSGVLGDPGGVDLSMSDGALLIGEVGWTGHGKIAVGYWQYTKQQDDLRIVDGNGVPRKSPAYGAYLLVDQPITRADAPGPQINLFARIGLSDGKTTPFTGGWQFGALIDKVFASRPDSQISFGINRGNLSNRYRANTADETGSLPGPAETGLELTYSDQIAPWLRVQPDIQYVFAPNGDTSAPNVVVIGLRFVVTAGKMIG